MQQEPAQKQDGSLSRSNSKPGQAHSDGETNTNTICLGLNIPGLDAWPAEIILRVLDFLLAPPYLPPRRQPDTELVSGSPSLPFGNSNASGSNIQSKILTPLTSLLRLSSTSKTLHTTLHNASTLAMSIHRLWTRHGSSCTSRSDGTRPSIFKKRFVYEVAGGSKRGPLAEEVLLKLIDLELATICKKTTSKSSNGATPTIGNKVPHTLFLDPTTFDSLPLQYASEYGYPVVVRRIFFLLTPNPQTQAQSSAVATPQSFPVSQKSRDISLRLACAAGHAQVVQILLREGGADVSAGEYVAVHWAAESGSTGVMKTVLDHVVSSSASMVAGTENGGVDPLRALVHSQNNYALRAACKAGHRGVVELLLKAGADIEACGYQALRVANEAGHAELVELLLEYQAKNQRGNKEDRLNGYSGPRKRVRKG
ncbi:hypothetical protein HK102_004015 [Quaeritorhiza haematococci]|nr:hypothetical protein HK102_004015 [Quaeritorhiza haematococci]